MPPPSIKYCLCTKQSAEQRDNKNGGAVIGVTFTPRDDPDKP